MQNRQLIKFSKNISKLWFKFILAFCIPVPWSNHFRSLLLQWMGNLFHFQLKLVGTLQFFILEWFPWSSYFISLLLQWMGNLSHFQLKLMATPQFFILRWLWCFIFPCLPFSTPPAFLPSPGLWNLTIMNSTPLSSHSQQSHGPTHTRWIAKWVSNSLLLHTRGKFWSPRLVLDWNLL